MFDQNAIAGCDRFIKAVIDRKKRNLEAQCLFASGSCASFFSGLDDDHGAGQSHDNLVSGHRMIRLPDSFRIELAQDENAFPIPNIAQFANDPKMVQTFRQDEYRCTAPFQGNSMSCAIHATSIP